MASEYHVFLPADECPVIVEEKGADAAMEFPSLAEATRHLRAHGSGFVVIHDGDMNSENRIPLSLEH